MIKANERRLRKLQKELAREYRVAEKELLVKIDGYMKAFRQADALQVAKLEKGSITQLQYNAWREAKLEASEWSKRMSNELARALTDEDVAAIKRVNKMTQAAAVEGSKIAQYEISMALGTKFTLISKSALAVAMTGKLYKKVNIARDLQWNEKHVRSSIIQSIMQGESVPKAATRLSKVAEMNRNAALRDARTMINAAEQGGKLAEYQEAQEQGINIEKGWMATLDERTRDSHAEMDMEFVGVDDKFSNGLEYPCDPDGAPEEVYNCRCTLITRINGVDVDTSGRINKLDG